MSDKELSCVCRQYTYKDMVDLYGGGGGERCTPLLWEPQWVYLWLQQEMVWDKVRRGRGWAVYERYMWQHSLPESLWSSSSTAQDPAATGPQELWTNSLSISLWWVLLLLSYMYIWNVWRHRRRKFIFFFDFLFSNCCLSPSLPQCGEDFLNDFLNTQ